jgi:hypothetical protein
MALRVLRRGLSDRHHGARRYKATPINRSTLTLAAFATLALTTLALATLAATLATLAAALATLATALALTATLAALALAALLAFLALLIVLVVRHRSSPVAVGPPCEAAGLEKPLRAANVPAPGFARPWPEPARGL